MSRNMTGILAAALMPAMLAACGGSDESTAQLPDWARGGERQAAADAPQTDMDSAASPMEDAAPADEHAGHAGHMMTPEQMAQLRERIALYREFTDAQIMQNMNRMPPDMNKLISDKGVRGPIGVLALGHGFSGDGNRQFETAYAEALAPEHPTAMALGMAMMSSDPIQKAVDDLEAQGARTIVVIPTIIGDNTSLVRQWQHIFGLRKEGAYLDLPTVRSNADIVIAQSPTTSPIMADIMTDYAKELSEDPANEVVVIFSHGPEDAEDNEKELEVLAEHADWIKRAGKFAAVHPFTVQDDAPRAVRAANVERVRKIVEDATRSGKRVLVVTDLLTGPGSVHRRAKKDLEGLDYVMSEKGLMEHPKFQAWLQAAVAVQVQDLANEAA